MAEVKLTDKTRKMGEGLVCLTIRLTRFQETTAALVLFLFFSSSEFTFMVYPFVFPYAVS